MTNAFCTRTLCHVGLSSAAPQLVAGAAYSIFGNGNCQVEEPTSPMTCPAEGDTSTPQNQIIVTRPDNTTAPIRAGDMVHWQSAATGKYCRNVESPPSILCDLDTAGTASEITFTGVGMEAAKVSMKLQYVCRTLPCFKGLPHQTRPLPLPAERGFSYQGKPFVGGGGSQPARFDSSVQPVLTTVFAPPLPLDAPINIRAPITGIGYVRTDNATSLAYVGTGDGSTAPEQFIAYAISATGSSLPAGGSVYLKSRQTGLYLRLVDASLYQGIVQKAFLAPPRDAVASRPSSFPPTGAAIQAISKPPPAKLQQIKALPFPWVTDQANVRKPNTRPPANITSTGIQPKPTKPPPISRHATIVAVIIPPAQNNKPAPRTRPPPRTKPPPRPYHPNRQARGLLAVDSYTLTDSGYQLTAAQRTGRLKAHRPPPAQHSIRARSFPRRVSAAFATLAGTVSYGAVADQATVATATQFVYTGSGLSHNGRLMVSHPLCATSVTLFGPDWVLLRRPCLCGCLRPHHVN